MAAFGLNDWADVDALADYQYMLRKPLCLVSGDAELLEAGLRAHYYGGNQATADGDPHTLYFGEILAAYRA